MTRMNGATRFPLSLPNHFANLQPRERAWDMQRGKKTLLNLTLVKYSPLFVCRSEVGYCVRPLTYVMEALLRLDGEFGWGGTPAIQKRRRPKVSSERSETPQRV